MAVEETRQGGFMKRFIARQVLIGKLAAVALGTLCLLQTQVNAQAVNGFMVLFPSVGLADGECLRLTLFNPNGTPVRAQAVVHHTGGMMVGLGDGSVRFIQAGVSSSFSFKRNDIPLAGEERTGRLQLRASLRIGVDDPATIERFAVSMETLSISDGTSNTVFVGEVIPTRSGGGGTDVLVGGDARDVLMGIVPGQTLRVTLLNQPPVEAETSAGSVGGHVKIFDIGGNPVAQSEEADIPPGESRSFDFDHDDMAFRGEKGTKRRQVRVSPFYSFKSGRLSRVVASFEIVDKRTGRTTVLVGHECLVFFVGGIPED
jgi:Ca2+-binding RTX toxin-like protein